MACPCLVVAPDKPSPEYRFASRPFSRLRVAGRARCCRRASLRRRQSRNYQVNIALGDRTLVANSKGDKVATELIAQERRPSRSTGLRGRDRELRQILEPSHQIADDPVSDSRAGRGYFSPMKPEASRPSVKQVERINL